MDKQNVVHTYSRIRFSHKKKYWFHVDEPWNIKLGKEVRYKKKHLFHNSISMKYSE